MFDHASMQRLLETRPLPGRCPGRAAGGVRVRVDKSVSFTSAKDRPEIDLRCLATSRPQQPALNIRPHHPRPDAPRPMAGMAQNRDHPPSRALPNGAQTRPTRELLWLLVDISRAPLRLAPPPGIGPP